MVEFDLTVEEGVKELSTICCIETNVGAVAYNQIPEPRDLGLELIDSLNIILSPAIQCRGVNVATRKKLNLKRKNQ